MKQKNIFSGKNVIFLEEVIANDSLNYRKKFRLSLQLNKGKRPKEKFELIKNNDNLKHVVSKGETTLMNLKVFLRSISTICRILRDKFSEDFEKVEIGKLTSNVLLEMKKR